MATLSQVDLLEMAREVLLVCQDGEYNLQDIIADLTISRSAQVTINRIFDGQFTKRVESTDSSDLPNASELFRSRSPEQILSPRSQAVTPRSRPTPAPAPRPKPSNNNVVVILSSDEEDNIKPDPFDDRSDTEDGFDELMKNIHLIKSGETATSKRTNGTLSAGAGVSTLNSTASTTQTTRKRTALSPPLILSYKRSPSIELAPSSPPYRELSPPIVARPTPSNTKTTSPTAMRTNNLIPKSADTTPTKRNNTRAGALVSEFTDKMPLSLEICSEWDDLPLLSESPSPPPRTKRVTPTKVRDRSRSPVVKSRSTDEKKFSPLPTEDDLLPRTREFNAASPVSRYSDVAWLKKVKAEKRTDRALSEEKESIWLDDDEDNEDNKYGIKMESEHSPNSKKITNGGAKDIFDDAGPNKWSKFESILEDDLSPLRTFKNDDDVDDHLRAIDTDDDWRTGIRKRSRNNAGLSVSPSKDLKKPKRVPVTPTKTRAKSGPGPSSSSVVSGVDHFDWSELDEYRNDPILLDDDDRTGEHSIEKEIERRRKLRQKQGNKTALKKTDDIDLSDLDDLSMAGKSRQRNGKAKAIDSDLEFNANNSDEGSDGSDTGASKPLTAKEKKAQEARLKREAAQRKKDADKAEKDAKAAAAKAKREADKAEKDLEKELKRSEKEAEAAERRAKGQTKENEAQKKRREREEERQAKAADAEAAKQAEREMRIANQLRPKSKSVEEIVLCMEESMFDSELGNALQTYLQAISCHIDLLKSPVSGAIAVAAAAAANTSSRSIGESSSSSLSDLNGTNDACPVRDLIFWRRIVTIRHNENGDAEILPKEEHAVELENYWLCHMTAEEFCEKVKENELHRFLETVSRDMRTRMRRQKAKQEAMGLTPPTNEDRTRRQRVILMIMGLSDYFRGLYNLTSQDFKAMVLAKMRSDGDGGGTGKGAKGASVRDGTGPNEKQIDKVLMELQLDEDCLVIHTDDYDESAQMIVSLTEQISQRPYKTGRKTRLNVCLDGIKCGTGYQDTWITSLQQIHMITPQVARSIASEYPTIRSLYEGYKRCASVYDAWSMLEGIRVENRASAIGQSISRRVYDVFMGEDPDAAVS
ncbi:putative monocarboxylate transporter mch1 [Linnemannia gamsii]|uniref:Monocarboxylate transporter mch1 n=1 Tax=Linnemannia gamsii TaxID=64522 RepID=A0ABQ7K034_9FUNG|nr:putative monocarboxylate transporter mch1 [Linnemannia gamsii]